MLPADGIMHSVDICKMYDLRVYIDCTLFGFPAETSDQVNLLLVSFILLFQSKVPAECKLKLSCVLPFC